jgi:ABC-type protease/lipase transport system fused ATPase/permease subunit
MITKRKEGKQKVTYSLKTELNKRVFSTNMKDLILEWTKYVEKEYVQVMKYLEGFVSTFDSVSGKEQVEIYYKIHYMINHILKMINVLNMVIIGNFADIEARENARKLKTIQNKNLQKVFIIASKIDVSMGEQVFMEMLDGYEPGLGTELQFEKKEPEKPVIVS